MKILRRLAAALVPLAIALVALAGPPVAAEASNQGVSPLVEKVRVATESFKDINAALSAGFVQGTPCVSGPDFGAMGVHFVLPTRIANGTLNAAEPEALIYEPTPAGAFRLVGVEYIVLASIWTAQHPGAGPPALDGHLMNFVDAPNRYGLPAFYEIHVWAWEDNPVGNFADWNTHVTCAYQPAG